VRAPAGTGFERPRVSRCRSADHDKAFIEERIRETFPDGFEGFHRVMHEANAQAVLSTAEAGASYPPAALESLVKAGERWWSRRPGE
jgi:hypothetical protein